MIVKKCQAGVLLCILLSACQSQPESRYRDTAEGRSVQKLAAMETNNSAANARRDVPEIPVNLERFHPPETLAGLEYEGEISSDQVRSFHYRNENRHISLLLMVYGLPAGWDSMSPERAVAGHYGELRQRQVEKALSDSANALTIVSERILDLEGHISAQAQMRWLKKGKPMQSRALLLILDGNTFIRVRNASYEQSPKWLLQQSKRALAEFRAAQQTNREGGSD